MSEFYVGARHRRSTSRIYVEPTPKVDIDMSEIYVADLCRRSTSEYVKIYVGDICRKCMSRIPTSTMYVGDVRRRFISKIYIEDGMSGKSVVDVGRRSTWKVEFCRRVDIAIDVVRALCRSFTSISKSKPDNIII
jgi:hypothetical protein